MSFFKFRLKPIEVSMAEDYFELSHSDGLIARYVPGLVEDYALSIDMVYEMSLYDLERNFAFLIINGNTPVGFLMANMDAVSMSLDVCYFIGAEHRGHGYMQKALKLFVSYLHRTRSPFNLLTFDVRRDNIASQRTLIAVGAKKLGISSWYTDDLFCQYAWDI